MKRATASRSGFLVVAALSTAYAVFAAARVAWTCDDAFISFRYAQHLVRGLGLVFNPGERVEGYSNFLWTLWIAAGMRLRVDPETWSIVWGIAFYAGTVALLAFRTWRAYRDSAGRALLWPVAALLAAAHPDWNRFATSGLETSLDAFLVTLSFLLLTTRRTTVAWTAAAGAGLALLALCRPDGPIFAAVGFAYVLVARRPRLRHAATLLASFLALWGPYTLWRVSYYGDFFPNPYYAKSAALAWYSQGWTYAALYFRKYWVAALGVPLAAVALVVDRAPRGSRSTLATLVRRDEVALAAAFALVYTFYVVRIGGDFMYARFLIPVTPLYLVLLEIGLVRLGVAQGAPGALVTILAVVGMLASPHPVPDRAAMVSGIVNEPTWYTQQTCADLKRRGEMLGAKYFHGLPVCLAFTGMQARLVFHAQPRIAIETTTGLTDRFIARQPLANRGRVGHEKAARADYVVERRHADLIVHFFNPTLFERLGLAGYIPEEQILLDDTGALLLRWNPPLLAELSRRGARMEDFMGQLDGAIASLDALSDPEVHRLYDEARHFYFDAASDSTREAAFRRRLARARAPAP